MSISLFERRSMAKALREGLPVHTFLRDTFFKSRLTFDTEKVDIDIVRGTRTLAPFVNLNAAAPIGDRKGFKTSTLTPPTVMKKRETNAASFLDRSPGENVYGEGKTPAQRAAEQVGRDLAELDEEITRREEWMCARALFDGEIPILGQGEDRKIEFDRSDTHSLVLDAADRWTAETADIHKNLRDWRKRILQSCGMNADIAVLGEAAANAFLSNKTLAAMLDTRRVDMGQIDLTLLPNGVTYLGRMKGTGVDLYEYSEWYYDEGAKLEKPIVPEKQVLIGCSNARTELRYGAVPVADEQSGGVTLVEGERVPDSWVNKEPAQRFIKVTARPLPVPVQIDAFLVAQVVA